VAEKRVADGFASQDAATQVAPHLTEWRIAPYEADLASSPLGVAQQDEIHARDGHRFFDETVEIGRKKAHGSILPLTRVVTLRVRYADETAILVFEGTDMRISARADYAVRATVALARTSGDELVQAERIAEEQGIPAKFLEGILLTLRRAGLVHSRRGANGGYRLALRADEISIGDVIRAVDGPLIFVRDERPSELDYPPAQDSLATLWVALRSSVRRVLDATTVADIATGQLPSIVTGLAAEPGAWENGPA
tara:strand:- start:1609 stop:2367 length:759 start_codon:yes stop_codon:yes gene_type:complete